MSSPPPVQLEVEAADDSMEEDSTDMLPPPDRFTQPARADEVLEMWRRKGKENALVATDFQDHWRITVPRIYSPQPNRTCLDCTFDEELGHRLLIQPLEQFIWGNVEKQALPKRSTLCGKVFKQGEPVYSCRECGMDNTCVLCVGCFKVSAHRHHKYKICQSGGGGCCDCGDTEAWKRDPFCDLHKETGDEGQQEENLITPEVVKRMKIVSAVCLSYCFRLLTQDHAPGLPNDLRMKDNERDPLQILDQPDRYCTVLYNDETHTFEQVIGTLARVIKCNHRDSVELVSLIDREGRALVKCTSFQVCDKLKADIEMFTSRHGPSLKVLVMHAHLVAHQTFAMKLLPWLQSFVSQEPKLRLAVSQVCLGECNEDGSGVAGGVMQNDCRMWKAARAAWHRLLIATTLMDYSTKKSMAVLFTKNYAYMLKDFMHDDHEHSFSVSSLSVQLYTTPTLAHHLIAHHDALFVVLNTFVSECNRRLNSKGRLEFDRNHVPAPFKRAQCILYDVKYLLSSVPTTFDDDLRKGFLHGLSLMMNLLVMMQGMDTIVRQVGQHMEYEPEWESAFNLHVKLAYSVTMALAWCASDRTLAANSYRMGLRRLADSETYGATVLRELGNQSASVIPYDVMSQPVSIHRPLSRFVAGLHLILDKHGLSYHSMEFSRTDKPKPTPEELIEPILRTWAMIAGVHAGMWRRNGFALLNQLYFYHNVKCRSEMLDRDVLMLQIGASLIESNEFIIHVLNKFNLLDWAKPDFETMTIEDDTLRHTVNMLEEFLGLLITVVGSRYVPGLAEVTQEDKTKKEIIQMLCVRPMAHSELNKSLPEDQLHETGLEAVIEDVAEFSPPGGSARGLYRLRPSLHDQYDVFFYHYTREELSRSEEAQRARRKAEGLPECCPPPALPKLTAPFRLLANLLQCESSILILKNVLERALDLRARSFSETQVHKALHLMGYALRDEESGHYEFLAFAETAHRAGLYALLLKLAQSPRIDAHRPLAQWVLSKMKSLLGLVEEGSGDADNMETDHQEKLPVDSTADAEKSRRAKLAAERRAKLIAQMQAAQNKFISNNATLFSEAEHTAQTDTTRARGVALGVSGGGAGSGETRVCIMCQEEAVVSPSSPPMVMVSFVQQSRVLAPPAAAPRPPRPSDARLPSGRAPAPHVSSCGHTLHAACWTKYVDSVVDKENRRQHRLRQPLPYDVTKREFLCPLCERLSNVALPLLPAPPAADTPALTDGALRAARGLLLRHQVTSEPVHHCTEMCEEMHCVARARSVGASSDMDTGDNDTLEETQAYLSTHAQDVLPESFLAHFEDEPLVYNDTIKSLIENFANMLPGICDEPTSGGLSSLAALYRATSYSIIATETLLEAEKRPLLGDLPARHKDALHILVRQAAIIPSIWTNPKQVAHHALSTLNALEKLSPLNQPAFGVLLPLVMSFPAIFSKSSGPARPGHLTKQLALQVFRANMTRALIVSDLSMCIAQRMDDDGDKNEDLANLLPFIKELRRGNINIDNLNPEDVWEVVKSQCRSFLRCCCLLFHFLSDIDPPIELTGLGGDTWENMCNYLDLPSSFTDLMYTPLAREKAMEWSNLSNEWFEGNMPLSDVLEPTEPPKLIPLPDDFSELMNTVSQFSCPNSDREDSKYPTLCLVCGQILCSQSYCCQTTIKKIGGGGSGGTDTLGAAVAHTLRCSAGAGLFVRPLDCETVLLAAPARGCAEPAPYLDHYGETDQGLRRGNPLRLCPEKYEALRMLWLSHGIHERIARSQDFNMLLTTRWQNM